MPKIKKARIGVKMDMTPMVDVAFLLLIFFMSTTQFKPPEDAPVQLPDSHSNIKLPESDILTITITKADSSGGRFTAHSSKVLMSTGIGKMDQALKLSQLDPKTQMFRLVHQNKDILLDNIQRARSSNPNFRMIIKADKNADFATVEEIMSILQKNNMPQFYLVNDLKK